jgi:hypothetical protein
MEFNEIWTKAKNDQLRNFIKEGRSVDFIKEYFGEDIEAHPKRKYSSNKLLPFKKFFEIKINPIETEYKIIKDSSPFFKDEHDYILKFFHKINYVILFLYFPIKGKETYNIIFTTENQYLFYKKELNRISKSNTWGSDEYEMLRSIIEKTTGYNEIFPVIKRVSYVILDFYKKNLNGKHLSIGADTNDPIKIKLYRNIIRDSFTDFSEIEEQDSEGNIYFTYSSN